MTKSTLDTTATGAKTVGVTVYAGASAASSMAASKLEEVGVTSKVKEGVGFMR